MKKPTISIGIPAYNEEANIAALLTSLSQQRETKGVLKEIIVVSDGSSDRTVKHAKSVHDPRIVVIARRSRHGKNAALQKIVSLVNTDILMLLDADVLPKNRNFIDCVVRRFQDHPSPDLVGMHTESLLARSFVERVFSASHNLKNDLYRRINRGNNVYLCYGRACALSRRLYTSIAWPTNCPEDAYTYLFCVAHGGHFQYAPEAAVLFRSPSTMRDYFLQSRRFRNGLGALSRFFDRSLIDREYHIPFGVTMKTLTAFLMLDPIALMAYLLVNAAGRLSRRSPSHHPLWEIATTSKQVREPLTNAP